jgi:hypothetical protein
VSGVSEGNIPLDSSIAREALPFAAPGGAELGRGPLLFEGCLLLTNGPDGPIAIPELNLGLDEDGISLERDDGTRVWSVAWSEVAEVATPERSTLNDGGDGVVLLITPTDGRSHRFVIPCAQPAKLEATIGSYARAMGVRRVQRSQRIAQEVADDSRHRSSPIWIVVAAATVIVVAVLVLAAAHTINL